MPKRKAVATGTIPDLSGPRQDAARKSSLMLYNRFHRVHLSNPRGLHKAQLFSACPYNKFPVYSFIPVYPLRSLWSNRQG